METGVELIAQERQEQILKHNRSIEEDVTMNDKNQLAVAAIRLIDGGLNAKQLPDGWWGDIWDKMINKSYKERLVIAGALIAAEIDRLNAK